MNSRYLMATFATARTRWRRHPTVFASSSIARSQTSFSPWPRPRSVGSAHLRSRHRGALVVVGPAVRSDTEEVAERIDRALESSVDEINGIAAEEAENHLPDSWWHRVQRRIGQRFLQQEKIVDQLRQYDPRDHTHYPTRPVGALQPRVVGTIGNDGVDSLQIGETGAERRCRDQEY